MSELKIEYLNSVKTELESRGWQPDRNGEPDCVDQASAAGADAINELIERRQQIKDLSLRIAVARNCFIVGPTPSLYQHAFNALTMPIESLHEFIKNNPQYGEKV